MFTTSRRTRRVVGALVALAVVAGVGGTATTALADERPPRSANESFAYAALTDLTGEAEAFDVATTAAVLDAGTPKAAVLRDLTMTDAWLAHVVDELYADVLDRSASDDERRYWAERIVGGWTVARVAAGFYASPELHAAVGGTDEAWITALYDGLLGRAPGPGDVDHWTGEIVAHGRGPVALRFFQTPESARVRVAGLYQHLLGRAAGPTETAYWAPLVVARGDLVLAVHLAASAEYQTRAEVRFP